MSPSESVTEGETDQESEPLDRSAQLERQAPGGPLESSDEPHIKVDESDHLGQYGQGQSDAASLKRRRVTRACDECRRKKIKCDGKQPCTHCTVYSYECTYDQPSNRRRNPPPQYIEALEARLARTQAVLHQLVPDLRLDDESLESVLRGDYNDTISPVPLSRIKSRRDKQKLTQTTSEDPALESMVDATGGLDLDEKGNWDYFGHSSNLFFLRRLRDHVGNLDGPEQTHDESLPHKQPGRGTGPKIRDPGSPEQLLGDSMQDPFESVNIGTDELPNKELALILCSAALDDACAVLSFVHHPTFYEGVERIYGVPEDQYQDRDHKFLPLLYVVLALGCLFAKDEHSDLERNGYKSAAGVGYKYFWAARQLMDITDCRDLTSLQAITFMIMFLQCSAKLATCYAYIGVALRSGMRMGLHRAFRDSFSPIEAECRKRVFWTIRMTDIYVGAILGLPLTLSEEEIDQDFPTEVTDECIREDGIHPMPEGTLPPMAAANANFRLCTIITKIVRTIYPIKGFESRGKNAPGQYSVSYTAIRSIEMDLQHWMEGLPPELVPRDKPPRSPGPPRLMRMQQLLRLGYAHAQLLLYRPFLHYVSNKHQVASVDQRSYACAAACVNVSRNIIHITSEMRKQGLLQGSYWFSMYSTFFGILSLVFFALENPQSANQNEILLDANEGKETLSLLAKRSMAADRCTLTLDALFEHLGPALERRKSELGNTGAHKRHASNVDEDKATPRAKTSHVDNSEASAPRRRTKKGTSAPRAGQSLRKPSRMDHSLEERSVRSSQSVGNLVQVPSTNSPANTTPTSSSFNTPVNPQSQNAFFPRRHPPPSNNQTSQPPFLPSQYHDPQHPSTLSDMAAVMFPSDNPFAYPNPPMNTLEQRFASQASQNSAQYHQQPGAVEEMYLQASTPGGAIVPQDDQLHGQFFGPMPPYMYGQGNNSMGSQSWAENTNTNQGRQQQGQQVPTTAAEMWNQQVRSHGLPGMNFDDIFSGEEWPGQQQYR